jgi:hypothetical protein
MHCDFQRQACNNNHTKIIFHSFVKCFDVNVVKNRYRLQTCTYILKF